MRRLLALVSFAFCALVSRGALARDYVVTSNADSGPVVCGAASNGVVTLREALEAANTDAACGDALAGEASDTIAFDLPVGSRVITLMTAPLVLFEPVVIDGGGLVELAGSAALYAVVELNGHVGSELRGLAIHSASGNGRGVWTRPPAAGENGGHVIVGCRIGLDWAGVARPNGTGIRIEDSDGNRIGGTAPGEGNIVSGNSGTGIQIAGDSAGTLLYGNLVGLAPDGVTPMPNAASDASFGLSISGPSNAAGPSNTQVGGPTAAHRNVFAGNAAQDVSIQGTATGTVFVGNYVGVDVTGMLPVQAASAWSANRSGIIMSGTSPNAPTNTVIGGAGPGEANVFGGYANAGIHIFGADATSVIGNRIGLGADGTTPIAVGTGISLNDATGVTLTANDVLATGDAVAAIFDATAALSGGSLEAGDDGVDVSFGAIVTVQGARITPGTGLAIDIEPSGPATNDALDADTGANGRMNFPLLDGALTDGATSIVTGRLEGLPSATIAVEIFSAGTGAASPLRTEDSLGSVLVETDAEGAGSFELCTARPLAPGERVTATATVLAAGTSELAASAVASADADAGASLASCVPPPVEPGGPDAGLADAGPSDGGPTPTPPDASMPPDGGESPARDDGGCDCAATGRADGTSAALVLLALLLPRLRRPARRGR